MDDPNKKKTFDEDREKIRKISEFSDEDWEMFKTEYLSDILKLDVNKIREAKKCVKIYQKTMPKESPIIIRDIPADHYFKASSPAEYYHQNSSNIMVNKYMDHDEIILCNKTQKLYITLPSSTSGKNLGDIAEMYANFIKLKVGHAVDFHIIKNLKTNEYDIVLTNCAVQNSEERKNIFLEFMADLSIEYKNLFRMSDLDICESVEKPTILSEYHRSDKKDQLNHLISSTRLDVDKIIKLIEESLYAVSKTSGDVKNINVNFTIQNISGDNVCTKNIYNESSDGIKNKLESFIIHIKNDKPSWYQSGKFLPKILLTNKFNEMFEDDITTRKLMLNLKKYDLKDKIIGKESYRIYEDENFTEEGKRYRGFIAI